MSKLNMVGCLATSLLLGSTAWGGSVAVSVADLGRGPENAPADLNHDIVRHDTSSGQVTIHHLTDTGLDLIESEFTLDGLELTDDQAGTEYSAGQIIFNNNGTNGSGARANYEVNGRITSLEITSSGSNHNVGTAQLNGIVPGLENDYGLRMFPLRTVNSNVNGTNANANAFVAPYPNKDIDDHSHVTGFRIISPGSGANIDGTSISSFRLSLYPHPDNDDTFGDIFFYTDSSGGISAVEHEDDTPGMDIALKIVHNLTDVLNDTEHTEVNDGVYYFNQLNTNGLTHNHYDTYPIGVQFKADGETVQFSSVPQIELYRGGEVVHVALHDEGSGFLSDPEFPDGSEQGGTGLSLNWQRRGHIHAITDFDPGSGYQSLPTLTISDPHGQGNGAQVTLLHTEAFQGGPRDMAYLDTGETALLPGGGWTSTPGDFNGDGSLDLFWWNKHMGASMIWILQNGHIIETRSLPLTSVELIPIVVDVDSDGKMEIFWWNNLTGTTWVWIIDPTGGEDWVSVSLPSTPIPDLTWELVAAGDRYGRPSIVWQSTIDGVVAMWTMSSLAPNAVEIATELTYPTGEVLVPGSNWHIVGTGDLNGDGLVGDLLWWAEEYNRIAIWIVGPDNFLAGDYLTYNGQEVIIDATLGGIGTYTTNGHVNLVWNDGQGVVNWQMDRGGNGFTSPAQDSIPLDNDFDENPSSEGGAGFRADGDDDGLDGDPVDTADDDGLEEETLGDQTPATTTTTNLSSALNYRIAGAWRMNADGSLTEMNIEIFAGLPPDLGTLPGEGGGLGDLGGFDDFDFGDLPDFGDLIPGGDDDPDGGLIGGAITIPAGLDPCDYICSLDREDPSQWPPEFLGPPASIIQGIWDILIDGLLDSYGCDPCAGEVEPLGACCSDVGCGEMTEAECTFPGTEWLGAGTTCEDDCN